MLSQRIGTLPRRHLGYLAASLALAVGACASAGATFRSGVGDTYLEHPPYFAGARTAVPGRAGHLPVTYQKGAAQAPVFDPDVSTAMADLLADMTHALDAMGVSTKLVEGGRVSAVTHAATRTPPDVHFGCVPPSGAFGDDCESDGDTVLGRRGQTMRLAVSRPSGEWTAWMQDVMREQETDAVLVVTLEVGQYLIRQRGWRGTKEVELGSDRTEALPWLTSLETPVQVIQLTGALVGPDGRAIRIGAEGLMARVTSLPLSAIGAQALITDEEVAALLTAGREDLPGRPLVWEAGLRTLVSGLLHDPRAP
ncbi:MAG TPA: hypothetical protein VJ997_11115 [Longimicrobiales bacterium]|nr:hypothetical protein [Longimicrobiales bacterium]